MLRVLVLSISARSETESTARNGLISSDILGSKTSRKPLWGALAGAKSRWLGKGSADLVSQSAMPIALMELKICLDRAAFGAG
jgi:hypothetical protein